MRRQRFHFAVCACVLALAMLAAGCATPPTYDVLIRDAHVVDGTGGPAFTGSVAINADRIVEVGPLSAARGRIEIDAAGLTVAPGFIDIHAHVLTALQASNPVEHFVRDGVTTVIDGNDGRSGFPIGETLKALEGASLSMNVGTFIGLSPVRQAVMGVRPGPASDADLARMVDLVGEGVRQGAVGLTSGLEPCLYHWPGYFTTMDELVALLAPVAQAGGLYASHIRDEGAAVSTAVAETIEVARRANVRTDVTHVKTIGSGSRENATAVVQAVDAARQRGIDVAFDQFPYPENGIDLTQLLPSWSFEKGKPALLTSLKNPSTRRTVASFVAVKIDELGGAETMYFRRCPSDASAAGQTLAAITRAERLPDTVQGQAEAYLRRIEKDDCIIDEAAIAEEAIDTFLRSPLTMVASDGGVGAHAKSYGTRARVLSTYVRDRKVLTLEEAVRRMTSLPAERLRLSDRGLLKAGAFADVVVFDAAGVTSRATRERPSEMSEGIHYVLVNGKAVLSKGTLTTERSGRVVRGPGAEKQN